MGSVVGTVADTAFTVYVRPKPVVQAPPKHTSVVVVHWECVVQPRQTPAVHVYPEGQLVQVVALIPQEEFTFPARQVVPEQQPAQLAAVQDATV